MVASGHMLISLSPRFKPSSSISISHSLPPHQQQKTFLTYLKWIFAGQTIFPAVINSLEKLSEILETDATDQDNIGPGCVL